MGALKTLHIVGYKNSGKTTLLERWIGIVKAKGLTVAVLKHHGHAGQIELPSTITDTSRFFDKGADSTLVAGGGSAQLLLNNEPSFGALKALVTYDSPDVLLIEGFKDERGAKVVLVRSCEDWNTLQELEKIQLVIGEVDPGGYPIIKDRGDSVQLDNWFTDWLNREGHYETI
ncbi:molybdopterin-guanine dinucleotide biosynthesis protein B [Sporosarcina sp. BI001-red]|uniref:molybdopterin-guanine dinucleotide biosynthesis protein B n=1 Tax=Sporosarcina sp. BI001-red TaxID=2282866 RepID=UPI000E22A231|nr:molybdopterin-guanine dinucleotide biosynthesis protein B [Sporosarcina sp. BI001-red]REB06002.1 molybdopterin-guanine dinucleotide biosynthesis protein B [Sporosarcina sp. BI001-red]